MPALSAKNAISAAFTILWLPTVGLMIAMLAAVLGYNGGLDRSCLLTTWACLLALFPVLAKSNGFNRWQPDWLGVISLALLALLAFSLRLSIIPFASFDTFYTLALLPLGYLFARTLPPAAGMMLIRGAQLLVIGLSIFAIVEFLFTRQRSTTVFLDANAFAALLNAVLFPSWAQWLAARVESTSVPRTAVVATLSAALALPTTTSMGGLLCFTVIGVPFAILSFRLGRRTLTPTVLLMVLLVMSYMFVFSVQEARPSPFNRIAAEVRTGGEATNGQGAFLRERLAMDRSTWAMVLEHPWLGAGIGTFRARYPAFRSPDDRSTAGNHAHNDYLEILADGGPLLLTGLLCFLAAAVLGALRAIRKLRPTSQSDLQVNQLLPLGLSAALGALFLHAAFNFIFYIGSLALLVGYWAALLRSTAYPSSPSKLDSRPLIRGRLAWILWASAALVVVGTLGVQTYFSSVLYGFCKLEVCSETSNHPRRMLAIANYLSVTQPSWLTARDYLADQYLRGARKSNDAVERNKLSESALAEMVDMVRRSPIYAAGYRQIGDLLGEFPRLVSHIPAGLPRDRLTLYRMAVRFDPISSDNNSALAKLLAEDGNDRGALQVIDTANRFRDLALVGQEDHIRLLSAGLPSALRLGRCSDAQAMAGAMLAIDSAAMPGLARSVLKVMPLPVSRSSAQALPTVLGCGLPPTDYALPAAVVVPAPAR